MTTTEIKQIVIDEMKIKIQSVLDNNDETGVDLYFVRPSTVIDYLKTLGAKEKDFETNGWFWDFWCYLIINNKRYSLSGDGYYHDALYFRLDNEE